jgi:hypothetical protein
MKLFLRFLTPGTILAAGLLLVPNDSPAIQRYTDLTKKPCLYCHVTMVNKLLLTDAGKYFQKHHTFDGYQPNPTSGRK